jgi:hypothetical protein
VKYTDSKRTLINTAINAIFNSIIDSIPDQRSRCSASVHGQWRYAFVSGEALSRLAGTELEAPEIDCGFERDDRGKRSTSEKNGQCPQAEALDHGQVRSCSTRSGTLLPFRRMKRAFQIMSQHCHVQNPNAPIN